MMNMEARMIKGCKEERKEWHGSMETGTRLERVREHRWRV